MNLDFISTTPATNISAGQLIHFGNSNDEAGAAQHGNVLAPLSQLAVLRASGADADSFLQGQLSNDIRKLTSDQAQLTSYSNPKGRMLAVIHLSRDHEGAVLMEVHRSVATPALKRLKMFVMRAKVELQDISETVPALGLAGPDAESILRGLALPAPAAVDTADTHDGVQVIRRAGAIARFSLRALPSRVATLWPLLAEHAHPVGTEAWRLLDIMAGLPVVYPETQEHFVAQMANLDQRNGISFDKGCYTGQEVIARLHHLGTLKRRLFLAQVVVPAVTPGTAIFAEGGEQAVGEVVDAAPSAEPGTLQLSFVLQLTHADSTLCCGNPNGAPLKQVKPAD